MTTEALTAFLQEKEFLMKPGSLLNIVNLKDKNYSFEEKEYTYKQVTIVCEDENMEEINEINLNLSK